VKAIAVIVTILAVPVVAFIWFASAITNVNADDYGVGKILIAVVIVLVAGLWWFALRKPIVESPAPTTPVPGWAIFALGMLIVVVLTIFFLSAVSV